MQEDPSGDKGIRLEETGGLRRSWVRVQGERTRLSQAETIGMEQRRGSESGSGIRGTGLETDMGGKKGLVCGPLPGWTVGNLEEEGD